LARKGKGKLFRYLSWIGSPLQAALIDSEYGVRRRDSIGPAQKEGEIVYRSFTFHQECSGIGRRLLYKDVGVIFPETRQGRSESRRDGCATR
jgi:hypothetical protein